MQGKLRLGFERDAAAGRTRLTERAHRPPLQVVNAFALPDGAAMAHLQNTSGGVLGGDSLVTCIDAGPGAEAQLTTTGATRLYRSAVPSVIATEARVGENGLLEWLPDPLIPFAGSRSRLETRIVLASGAGLFWWEILLPGRAAHGETFAYERLDLSFVVETPEGLLVEERACLEPALRPLNSPARLGPFRALASLTICRVGAPPPVWRACEQELSDLAQSLSCPGVSAWGVSALAAYGLAVRGLSVTGRDLPAGLTAFWRAAKQMLYERDIVVPRKVY